MTRRTVLLSAFAGPLVAHHGWTGYDEKQTLNLTGVIRESGWEQPHGYVKVQVDGGKGKTWHAVLAPPTRMESRGMQRDQIKPGATVTVIGYPHRGDAGELRVERIIIGGKTTELR